MPGKVFLSAQGLKALPCQHFPATDGGARGLEDLGSSLEGQFHWLGPCPAITTGTVWFHSSPSQTRVLCQASWEALGQAGGTGPSKMNRMRYPP